MSTVSVTVARPAEVRTGASLAVRLRRRHVPAAVVLMLLAAGLAHGYNMLHFPYLTDDEGTYFSQGWAVFHLGRLAPYTYLYDHAPLGWIQIALWQLFTGGASFGYGLASGRVLMLAFQIGSTLAVIGIGRRATGRLWVGLLAAVLMALLPFGIYYQRRILLDNIATFWMLVSLYALAGPTRLRAAWLSGAAIAVAVLSKETAIAAVAPLLVLVLRRYPTENRRLAVGGWVALVVSICSVYVLLALLKGELFPPGSLLGSARPHVSLLCSLLWQSTRIDPSGSASFSVAVRTWAHVEPLLVFGGAACAAYLIVVCRRRPVASTIGWIAALVTLVIARNGVVYTYYLLPLLPLLGLSLAIAFESVVAGVRRWAARRAPGARARPMLLASVAAGLGVAAIGVGAAVDWARSGTSIWTGDPVAGQLAAERWIERHLPHDSRMVIDMSMWQDLHRPAVGAPFRYAEYDWKAAEDPAVRDLVFADSWKSVGYVITTPSLIGDTEATDFPVVAGALEHSVLVRSFDTGGWRIQVRRVEPRARRILMPLAMKVGAPVSPGPSCMQGQV